MFADREYPDDAAAEASPVVLAAECERLREFIGGDAHHHMSTVAGLLRIYGDPAFAVEANPAKLVALGDRLAECCARARAALGLIPTEGGDERG